MSTSTETRFPDRRPWGRPALLPTAAVLLALLSGCTTVSRPGYERDMGQYPEATRERPKGFTQTGWISYYAHQFHGRKTANGESFDMHDMTAAHRTLPFNTKVQVTNLDNGRSVIVRINDRGPYAKKRVLDLSLAAAKEIGLVKKGTVKARVTVITD